MAVAPFVERGTSPGVTTHVEGGRKQLALIVRHLNRGGILGATAQQIPERSIDVWVSRISPNKETFIKATEEPPKVIDIVVVPDVASATPTSPDDTFERTARRALEEITLPDGTEGRPIDLVLGRRREEIITAATEIHARSVSTAFRAIVQEVARQFLTDLQNTKDPEYMETVLGAVDFVYEAFHPHTRGTHYSHPIRSGSPDPRAYVAQMMEVILPKEGTGELIFTGVRLPTRSIQGYPGD